MPYAIGKFTPAAYANLGLQPEHTYNDVHILPIHFLDDDDTILRRNVFMLTHDTGSRTGDLTSPAGEAVYQNALRITDALNGLRTDTDTDADAYPDVTAAYEAFDAALHNGNIKAFQQAGAPGDTMAHVATFCVPLVLENEAYTVHIDLHYRATGWEADAISADDTDLTNAGVAISHMATSWANHRDLTRAEVGLVRDQDLTDQQIAGIVSDAITDQISNKAVTAAVREELRRRGASISTLRRAADVVDKATASTRDTITELVSATTDD